MKELIRQRIRESFAEIPDEDFIRAYSAKINEKYDNLLKRGEKNQNFAFVLGNKVDKARIGEPNKCETNVFEYIKKCLSEGWDSFYPVGGFEFVNTSLFPVEHWWVYDNRNKLHIDITPYQGDPARCYAGIINTQIQEDIRKANKFYDVDFFKGGHVQHTYFK